MENFKFHEDLDYSVAPRLRTNTQPITDKSRDCPDCALLKQSLSECKRLLSTAEKKNKILIAQKSDLQKDFKTLENSYSGLKRNSENPNFDEIIHKKEVEIHFLKEELKKTQILFQDLNQEYDSFTINMSNISNKGEIDDFDQVLKEKDEIIKEKELALAKAQEIIKRLNEECEVIGAQLLETEEKNPGQTLASELKILKKKYKDLKSQQFEESEQQSFVIESLTREKFELENALDELNQKFVEIEKIADKRMKDFCEYLSKIQELEEEVVSKSNALEKHKKKVNELELSKQLEIESLKKSAKLAFGEITPRSEPITNANTETLLHKFKDLKQVLKEMLYWDCQLQKNLKVLVESESEYIQKNIFQIDTKAEQLHADFEKWVMRNEELEQRLVSVENNNLKLIRIIADLQKLIFAKDRQFDEVVKIYSGIGKEMQSTVDFLSVELSDKQAIILKELLPTVFESFHKALAQTQVEVYKNFRRVKNNNC